MAAFFVPKRAKSASWLRSVICAAVAVAAVLIGGQKSFAGYSLTFTNTYADDTGTGYGNITTVMSLQQKGSATTEAGSVSWDGTQTVISGDALNNGNDKSQTLTATYIKSITGWTSGALDFAVIFQVNQANGKDQSLTVYTFNVDFFNADGTTQGSATYNNTSGLSLTGVGGGTSGWVFDVHLDATQAASFFASGSNRLGMSIPGTKPFDSEANDGPDYFYVASLDGNNNQQEVVPAPSSAIAAISGIGLVGLIGFVRSRRRQAVLAA